MKPLINAQELARKNNENAAVHAAYRKRRKLRRQLGVKSKRPKKALDALDWQAAEREARPVRAVGFFLSKKPAVGGLTTAEVRIRLEQIELATVSALRALQMDIGGDEGTPSATVIKRARAALR